MSRVKKAIVALLILILMLMLGACASKGTNETINNDDVSETKELTLDEITESAKQEGRVVSIGMPDTWANWKDTWEDLNDIYGISHSDTDMSSAEEIAKMEAEKDKPTADIGDVGIAFAPVAVQKGVTEPFKTSYWDEIPDWAKDDEGHWMLGYTGTISFMANTKLVENPPESWNDLKEGGYSISIGDVGRAAQANNTIVACALALGGDESNIEPAIAFFEELAKEGRITTLDPSIANFESGEVEVGIMWDFNALNYRDKLGKDDYYVCIPSEGSVISGYATIINKYAPHPNAAKLTREYILSDQGQINLARGYARPIRPNIEMPEDVLQIMLPNKQYKNAKPISDFDAWNKTTETLAELWQSRVLIHMN